MPWNTSPLLLLLLVVSVHLKVLLDFEASFQAKFCNKSHIYDHEVLSLFLICMSEDYNKNSAQVNKSMFYYIGG